MQLAVQMILASVKRATLLLIAVCVMITSTRPQTELVKVTNDDQNPKVAVKPPDIRHVYMHTWAGPGDNTN